MKLDLYLSLCVKKKKSHSKIKDFKTRTKFLEENIEATLQDSENILNRTNPKYQQMGLHEIKRSRTSEETVSRTDSSLHGGLFLSFHTKC